VSEHFGRVGDCLVAGFSVPFAVSFTFVLRWWPKKQKMELCEPPALMA